MEDAPSVLSFFFIQQIHLWLAVNKKSWYSLENKKSKTRLLDCFLVIFCFAPYKQTGWCGRWWWFSKANGVGGVGEPRCFATWMTQAGIQLPKGGVGYIRWLVNVVCHDKQKRLKSVGFETFNGFEGMFFLKGVFFFGGVLSENPFWALLRNLLIHILVAARRAWDVPFYVKWMIRWRGSVAKASGTLRNAKRNAFFDGKLVPFSSSKSDLSRILQTLWSWRFRQEICIFQASCIYIDNRIVVPSQQSVTSKRWQIDEDPKILSIRISNQDYTINTQAQPVWLNTGLIIHPWLIGKIYDISRSLPSLPSHVTPWVNHLGLAQWLMPFGRHWVAWKLGNWWNPEWVTLPKFNSSPLKSYRAPIGKDRLPTTIFQGRAVKLRGCGRNVHQVSTRPMILQNWGMNTGKRWDFNKHHCCPKTTLVFFGGS